MANKEMLINVSQGEECRIALIEDGRLEELYMERASATSHVGNIYKGRVTNVEASIQAAFVDFGLGRNGFLHISDLMPSYFGHKNDDFQESVGRKLSRRDRPPIQRCLRRGDEIVVQIIKEGIGTKGPTLTTYLSIPGRILVMMPGMGKMGVSKKIEDEEERRRLRQILDSLKPPQDVGFIIRTAGIGKSKLEIQRDLTFLTRLWQNFSKKRDAGPGPIELYTEGDLVTRTVRDVFTPEVERIVVDNANVAQHVREVIKLANPRLKNPVVLYEDPIPLFHRYNIEREIELMHSRHVPLPSGGSLVIDSTEAIVAIDVNSGKFRDHSDAETTAFKTDMEAADEIPRQLRLRDLGGVIICDFIDLRFERHRRELEERLEQNFQFDRAKTKVLRMSQFGIIELTRQRMRPSLKRSIYFDCPHCKGAGLVKTPESMSLDVMRRLAIAAYDERVERVELSVCADVASYLQNRRRQELAELEHRAGKNITIKVDSKLALDDVKFELFDTRDGAVFLEELGMESQGGQPPATGGRPPRGRGRGRGERQQAFRPSQPIRRDEDSDDMDRNQPDERDHTDNRDSEDRGQAEDRELGVDEEFDSGASDDRSRNDRGRNDRQRNHEDRGHRENDGDSAELPPDIGTEAMSEAGDIGQAGDGMAGDDASYSGSAPASTDDDRGAEGDGEESEEGGQRRRRRRRRRGRGRGRRDEQGANFADSPVGEGSGTEAPGDAARGANDGPMDMDNDAREGQGVQQDDLARNFEPSQGADGGSHSEDFEDSGAPLVYEPNVENAAQDSASLGRDMAPIGDAAGAEDVMAEQSGPFDQNSESVEAAGDMNYQNRDNDNQRGRNDRNAPRQGGQNFGNSLPPRNDDEPELIDDIDDPRENFGNRVDYVTPQQPTRNNNRNRGGRQNFGGRNNQGRNTGGRFEQNRAGGRDNYRDNRNSNRDGGGRDNFNRDNTGRDNTGRDGGRNDGGRNSGGRNSGGQGGGRNQYSNNAPRQNYPNRDANAGPRYGGNQQGGYSNRDNAGASRGPVNRDNAGRDNNNRDNANRSGGSRDNRANRDGYDNRDGGMNRDNRQQSDNRQQGDNRQGQQPRRFDNRGGQQGGRPQQFNQNRPQQSGQRFDNRNAPRQDQRDNYSRDDRPRNEGQRNDGPRNQGPRNNQGYRNDEARPNFDREDQFQDQIRDDAGQDASSRDFARDDRPSDFNETSDNRAVSQRDDRYDERDNRDDAGDDRAEVRDNRDEARDDRANRQESTEREPQSERFEEREDRSGSRQASSNDRDEQDERGVASPKRGSEFGRHDDFSQAENRRMDDAFDREDQSHHAQPETGRPGAEANSEQPRGKARPARKPRKTKKDADSAPAATEQAAEEPDDNAAAAKPKRRAAVARSRKKPAQSQADQPDSPQAGGRRGSPAPKGASADKHLAQDEPIAAPEVNQPSSYRDLDAIPDDFD